MNRKEQMKSMFMAAVVISLTACSEKKTEQQVDPIAVSTETVKSASEMSSRTYVGVIEEASATSVSFTGSGMLTHVCVEEGQQVSAGQLIAEIDPTQSKNLLSAAESQMKQANDALARMKLLHDNGSLAEIKWVETTSKVEQAKAQLELARKSLADCKVYSPVSGIVGKGVKITKGVEADNMTHTYNIKIHLSNTDHQLLPGMVCQVKCPFANSTSGTRVSVPITAVQKDAHGKSFVWTAKGNKAHRTYVEKGRASGNRIAIEQGLTAGDIVVTEGYQKLSEGTEIKK